MQGAGEAGEFEQAFRELQAWTDTTEDKHALLHARFQYRQGRYASAIKCVPLPIILCVSELSSATASKQADQLLSGHPVGCQL